MGKEIYLSNEELTRYSRHITLDNVGITGQKKLKKASVLVVGSGGLGSPIIQYLTASGIGRLGIVDNDLVDLTNLQRQVIHNLAYIGMPKTISASNWVQSINPNCEVNQYNILLDINNAEEICKEYDIICDCTDNFVARYILNDVTVKQGKPYVYGSILGFEGQVGVFNLRDSSPSYRDLVPTPPPADLIPNCVENGVLGVLPGIIGTLQATEALKIILGKGMILDGRILTYNALKLSFRIFNIAKVERNQLIRNIDVDKSQLEISNLNNILPQQLKALIDSNAELVIVDVRSYSERDICKINNSLCYPSDKILNEKDEMGKLLGIDPNKKIVLYCKSGLRSKKCLSEIIKYRSNVYSLEGGIMAWIENIDNSIPRY